MLVSVFSLYLVHKIRVLVPQLNVVEPGKLGIRIMVWLEPRMFGAESLGKVYAKDLEISKTGWSMNFITWKSLLLWNNNLYLSGQKKKNLNKQNDGEARYWLGVVNFHCTQMSLLLSVQSIFSDDGNNIPCSSLFFCSLAMHDVISLKS